MLSTLGSSCFWRLHHKDDPCHRRPCVSTTDKTQVHSWSHLVISLLMRTSGNGRQQRYSVAFLYKNFPGTIINRKGIFFFGLTANTSTTSVDYFNNSVTLLRKKKTKPNEQKKSHLTMIPPPPKSLTQDRLTLSLSSSCRLIPSPFQGS